ncbi:MAG: 2-succinyl-6-hydroxy-2,4-cyclohexadiene-1-carboxylate synthase [SAR324 cluster bacterium]|nr:2-succinyl-6-hydroxy-2,4-cyclohexadiene-1-carboxylate synthase [SAR324 cluster bacterium]
MASSTLQLHADCDDLGDSGRPVLVLLHGFTGSGDSWRPVREGLRGLGPTIAVDLAGHGASPAPPEPGQYSMGACLDQLEALMERLGVSGAWWVGYSMGGRVALQMAARKPALVQGLVLVSATAGLSDEVARKARVAADEELAGAILSGGMEAFVERWLSNPLFSGLRKLPPEQRAEQRRQRLACNPLGLANSLRGMGSGAMPPLWERLAGINVPALLLAGGEDAKFSALAVQLKAGLPRATLRIIPGVNHLPHVEAPGAFLDAVNAFLREL